ncbi:hypothetical protein K504DRAFT_501094 [Pleomassaria siparia CBS 279.74]|uniref:Uncharacterized protein n=1 Tax=Pleomassaria siparia CBS 279.74 TaxID=1314801 RepID=A0A6G1KEB3_9PLEO|nr:hypothetical protein K504DRAFT_501094 [Pleomassaria siparia CBS 279.74]
MANEEDAHGGGEVDTMISQATFFPIDKLPLELHQEIGKHMAPWPTECVLEIGKHFDSTEVRRLRSEVDLRIIAEIVSREFYNQSRHIRITLTKNRIKQLRKMMDNPNISKRVKHLSLFPAHFPIGRKLYAQLCNKVSRPHSKDLKVKAKELAQKANKITAMYRSNGFLQVMQRLITLPAIERIVIYSEDATTRSIRKQELFVFSVPHSLLAPVRLTLAVCDFDASDTRDDTSHDRTPPCQTLTR